MAQGRSQQTQQAFQVLQPLCVSLIKEPTLENVQMLRRLLEGVAPDARQQLYQYILFPLRLILREPQKRSQELCEQTVLCMCDVLKHCTISEWDMFSDLFSVLSILISCRTNVGKVAELSEELKLAVVNCLIALIQSANEQINRRLYQPSFLPALGHLVSLLLSAAEQEKMRELKVQAMECLLHLAQCSDEGWQKNPYSSEARVAFTSFLPGIAMAICKVILGDTKQGQNVTVVTIQLWSRLVSLVMSEDGKHKSQSDTRTTHQSPRPDTSRANGESLLIKRTPEWVESTAKKLNILIGQIVDMVTNPHWKVRMAMAQFAKDLIFECKCSLTDSTPKLLELLVSLVGDEYSQVATLSQETLKEFSQHHLDGEAKQLVELLEDNLYSLMTVLPRLVRAADDTKKLSTLNLVIGYLKLLGPRITTLLYSAAHLKRLSLALIQVVEFDTRDVKILEDVHLNADTTSRLEAFQYYKTRRKYFKHFTDEAVYEGFVKICHLLGQYGNITLLVNHFLDLFHTSSPHRKQVVLILNEIVLGTLETGLSDSTVASWESSRESDNEHLHDSEEIETSIRLLVQEYTSDDNWQLPTNIDQSECSESSQVSSNWMITPRQQIESFSLATVNSNALLICLLLEGIGAFAQVLGAGFNGILMECLYPVLEKLADEKAIISQSAYNTLADICSGCAYSSIPDLLCDNADYLVDTISLKLRHLDFNPKAPLVLKVTLQHSNSNMLPLLEDTINEILITLDQYYGDRAAAFMKVLHVLVISIVRWFPAEQEYKTQSSSALTSISDNNSLNPSVNSHPSQDIKAFFLEYHRNKRIAAGDMDDADIDDAGGDGDHVVGQDEDQDDVDEKKVLPIHVQAVQQVLERCLHFVSSKDPRLRLLVLDVIQNGVIALAYRKEELLPIIHKLWPGFVQRFSDSELLVTCKACETLFVMGETCCDFIRRRVAKDVWPKTIKFLTTQAKISIKTGPSYKHTAAHKLQKTILGGIGRLCKQVDIGESELCDMLTACLPYLSARQPEVLQKAAVESVCAFMSVEPDSVWLALNDLYCPSSLSPPHQVFPEIKFAGSGSEGMNILPM
ncbi:TELO2-interacting protein 1 homolog [Amphiura filiformis]|uniref:TELO2-interacting protein 1 homolog n=1 Tax=Amphiura filiformis TaxID=82378 RepID=UPI003B21C25F